MPKGLRYHTRSSFVEFCEASNFTNWPITISNFQALELHPNERKVQYFPEFMVSSTTKDFIAFPLHQTQSNAVRFKVILDCDLRIRIYPADTAFGLEKNCKNARNAAHHLVKKFPDEFPYLAKCRNFTTTELDRINDRDGRGLAVFGKYVLQNNGPLLPEDFFKAVEEINKLLTRWPIKREFSLM
jgi:hypothetical protein